MYPFHQKPTVIYVQKAAFGIQFFQFMAGSINNSTQSNMNSGNYQNELGYYFCFASVYP